MLALVCCRNPDNVHGFGTIFTNHSHSKLAFASLFSATQSRCNMRIGSCPIVIRLGGLCSVDPDPMGSNNNNTKKTKQKKNKKTQKKQHCNSELAKWHDIHAPEECAGEWMQNNAGFKELCNERLHLVRHHGNPAQSFNVSTVQSHSLVP